MDYVGERFIAGCSDPLHFLGISYRYPIKLRCYERTIEETTQEAIECSRKIFIAYGWPDVVRVDAGVPFSGRIERSDGVGARSISQYAEFLLTNKVIPILEQSEVLGIRDLLKDHTVYSARTSGNVTHSLQYRTLMRSLENSMNDLAGMRVGQRHGRVP